MSLEGTLLVKHPLSETMSRNCAYFQLLWDELFATSLLDIRLMFLG